jgi:hypothetical protein
MTKAIFSKTKRMNTNAMRARTPFQLLLFFLLSVSGCQTAHVEKFTVSGKHTYFQVQDGQKVQKVYTEIQPNRMVVVVLDEANQPQLIRLSFADNAGRRNTLLMEFSQTGKAISAGKNFSEEKFLRSLTAANGKFEEWKKKYLSFPSSDPKYTKRYVIPEKLGDNRDDIVFADRERIKLRFRDFFCGCKDGKIWGECFVSALRCALDNLCELSDCVETGEWTPECSSNLEKAKLCLGQYEK